MRARLSLLIDLPETDPSYRYTVDALEHAISARRAPVDVVIARSDAIGRLGDGVFIGPGSPYRDNDAMESAIERARRLGIPLVGT